MKKILFILMALITLSFMVSCGPPSSDTIQRNQQESILAAGTATVGMPAVTNFRERKLLKMIYELRDNSSYLTYSYLFSQMNGKYVFIGQTIGYPIPYATQFTNPMKRVYDAAVLPQADPNGLFSPSSAAGTWLVVVDPKGEAKPSYIEENVQCFPYKLPREALMGYVPANY